MSDYLEWFDHYPNETLDNQNNNTLLKIPWDDKKDDKKAYTFIVRLAQILAPLRGTLTTWETRDTQGTEYAYALPIVEEPSRAITQLRNLARGHALISGRNYITLDDIPILIKVVLSTASIERVKIFDLLLSADGQLSTSQITKALDTSSNTAKRTMTEFKGLGIVDWVQEYDGGGYENSEKTVKLKNKFSWFLTDEFKSLRNGFAIGIEHNDDINKKIEKMPQEKKPPTTLFDSSFNNVESQDELEQDEHVVELMECYYCIEFPPTTNKKDYETHVVLKHKKNAYPGLVDLEKNNLKPKGKSWEV